MRLQLLLLVVPLLLLSGCDDSLSFPDQQSPIGKADAVLAQTQMVPEIVSADISSVEVSMGIPDDRIYAVYRFIYLDDERTAQRVSNDLPEATEDYTAIVSEIRDNPYPFVRGYLNLSGLELGAHNISLLAYRIDEESWEWDLSQYFVFQQTFTIAEPSCVEHKSSCDGLMRRYCEGGRQMEEECQWGCEYGSCVPRDACSDDSCEGFMPRASVRETIA